MNTTKSILQATVMAFVFLFLLNPLVSNAGDAEITLKSPPRHCKPSRVGSTLSPKCLKGPLRHCKSSRIRKTLSPKCLKAILRHRELGAMIDRIPAIKDGRITKEELMTMAARSRIVEPAKFPRDGDPGEIASMEHLADDGRTLRFMSSEEIAVLEEGEGFPVKAIVLNPVFGPTELQNWPPFPPPDPFPIPPPGLLPPPPDPDNLNIGEFLEDIHAALAPNVNGYALRIRRKGETVGVLQWNWARNPNLGDVPGLGWNSSRRMHVASISKFMTSIGLVHLLENTDGLNVDDFIVPFLPNYWAKTAGSNEFIRFTHLLDHRSGFSTGGSASNWQTMKSNVQAGVTSSSIGSFDYENMNFGLIRILIATIGGYIHPATNFGNQFFNDIIWDAITWLAYNDYMQTYVFGPVAAFPVIDTNAQSVLAYRFDGSTAGWDSGNFVGSAGGVGWHMTINEILDVTRALRKGQLVSIGGMSDILNESWGMNSPIDGESTEAGNIYYKAGRWTTSINNPAAARTEQCFVLIQPNKQIELVVFVNSNITSSGISLTNLVRTTFINNIERQ